MKKNKSSVIFLIIFTFLFLAFTSLGLVLAIMHKSILLFQLGLMLIALGLTSLLGIPGFIAKENIKLTIISRVIFYSLVALFLLILGIASIGNIKGFHIDFLNNELRDNGVFKYTQNQEIFFALVYYFVLLIPWDIRWLVRKDALSIHINSSPILLFFSQSLMPAFIFSMVVFGILIIGYLFSLTPKKIRDKWKAKSDEKELIRKEMNEKKWKEIINSKSYESPSTSETVEVEVLVDPRTGEEKEIDSSSLYGDYVHTSDGWYTRNENGDYEHE